MTSDNHPPELPVDRASRLRHMNERIRRMRDEFEGGAARVHALMCECIDPSCSTMLQVSGAELAAARHDDGQFIVDATHVDGGEVVQVHESFAVVRFS